MAPPFLKCYGQFFTESSSCLKMHCIYGHDNTAGSWENVEVSVGRLTRSGSVWHSRPPFHTMEEGLTYSRRWRTMSIPGNTHVR